MASPVNSNFSYSPDGKCYERGLKQVRLSEYDAVLLRLPHPVPDGFWNFLATQFPNTLFINDPRGIEATGTKVFLLNFRQLCPPMKHCTSLDDIEGWRSQMPLVLKPVKGYGGRGIVKLENNTILLSEGGSLTYKQWTRTLKFTEINFIAMPFLKNVSQGDKRIVVCCRNILGAALRKPKPGSWVCNVSQGGSSVRTKPDDDEMAIILEVTPVLEGFGVLFFGIDTLVNDEGKRVLSEINTLSVGGLVKMEEHTREPISMRAADLLWNYINAPDDYFTHKFNL